MKVHDTGGGAVCDVDVKISRNWKKFCLRVNSRKRKAKKTETKCLLVEFTRKLSMEKKRKELWIRRLVKTSNGCKRETNESFGLRVNKKGQDY